MTDEKSERERHIQNQLSSEKIDQFARGVLEHETPDLTEAVMERIVAEGPVRTEGEERRESTLRESHDALREVADYQERADARRTRRHWQEQDRLVRDAYEQESPLMDNFQEARPAERAAREGRETVRRVARELRQIQRAREAHERESPLMDNFQEAQEAQEGAYYHREERSPPMECVGLVKLPLVNGYSLVAYRMNEREILYAVGCQMGTINWWADNLEPLLVSAGYGGVMKARAEKLFWNAVNLINRSRKLTEEDGDDSDEV